MGIQTMRLTSDFPSSIALTGKGWIGFRDHEGEGMHLSNSADPKYHRKGVPAVPKMINSCMLRLCLLATGGAMLPFAWHNFPVHNPHL